MGSHLLGRTLVQTAAPAIFSTFQYPDRGRPTARLFHQTVQPWENELIPRFSTVRPNCCSSFLLYSESGLFQPSRRFPSGTFLKTEMKSFRRTLANKCDSLGIVDDPFWKALGDFGWQIQFPRNCRRLQEACSIIARSDVDKRLGLRFSIDRCYRTIRRMRFECRESEWFVKLEAPL